MPTISADAGQRENVSMDAGLASLFWLLLSYRTPMKMQELVVYPTTSYYRCPRCRITLDREYVSFCDRCGQSLDWVGYRKATKIYIGRKK